MPRLTRRHALVTGLAAVAAPSIVRAQAWPAQTTTVVVPFPPGGSTDAIARMAQPGLQAELGTNVIIENKPGASGSLGTGQVAKAKPDGATWLVVFDTHGVNPALYPNLNFNTLEDLEPVTLVGTAPHVIAIHPSAAHKTWADAVTASKAKAGGLNYGSIGTGSLGHLTMLRMMKAGGFPMTHIPYRGGGPLNTDMVGGKLDLGIASTGLFGPQLAGKTILPLLQTGKTRLPTLPDTPTAIEAGFPGMESVAWWGVFAPKGTPADLITRFRSAFIKTLQGETNAKTMREGQQITTIYSEPAALKTFVAEQIALWTPVIRENDIKPGN
ncbi:MAG: hypothetical protein RL291_113 [Pseudomonadota bacterium]|jgi:tripartite-type tricarboxylate transporter receptor subunit TctC